MYKYHEVNLSWDTLTHTQHPLIGNRGIIPWSPGYNETRLNGGSNRSSGKRAFMCLQCREFLVYTCTSKEHTLHQIHTYIYVYTYIYIYHIYIYVERPPSVDNIFTMNFHMDWSENRDTPPQRMPISISGKWRLCEELGLLAQWPTDVGAKLCVGNPSRCLSSTTPKESMGP
jgi:hypothetical protein